jgi:hypothetical protein
VIVKNLPVCCNLDPGNNDPAMLLCGVIVGDPMRDYWPIGFEPGVLGVGSKATVLWMPRMDRNGLGFFIQSTGSLGACNCDALLLPLP